MTRPLLLLSGAGLRDWIWDDVRAALPAESRVAPRPDGTASLARIADAALEAAAGWDSFTVVAHSIGGAVAGELVARADGRVAGVVGVSAVVPAAGRSVISSFPFPQRLVLGSVVRLTGTRPPAKVIRDGLGKGLPDDVAQRLVDEFVPESRRLYLDPVPPRIWPAETAYVITTEDDLAVKLQEKSAAELGGASHRLATGHLPMLQSPAELARLISAVGAD